MPNVQEQQQCGVSRFDGERGTDNQGQTQRNRAHRVSYSCITTTVAVMILHTGPNPQISACNIRTLKKKSQPRAEGMAQWARILAALT